MNATAWTDHRRISNLYLVSIIAFAAISMLSFGIARLEHLFSDGRIMSAHLFGQLLGLHKVLLHYFVLLPAIPTVLGYALLPPTTHSTQVAFPRLALTSWILFVTGGLLVCWAFVWGGIEPGWAFAAASPLTQELVSSEFLAGLFLGCLSLQLTGIIFLVTLHRIPHQITSLFNHSLYWISWLMVFAFPVLLSAISLALVVKLTPFSLFDSQVGGEFTLLAFMAALASTPMKTVLLLSVLASACAAFQPERSWSASRVRRVSGAMAAAAAFSVLAVDTTALPSSASPLLLMVGSFNNTILLCLLFTISLTVLVSSLKQGGSSFAATLYAAGALTLVLMLVPLDLYIGLPGAAALAASYMGEAVYYLLFGGTCLLALLGGTHFILEQRGGVIPGRAIVSCVATILCAGLVMAFLPMLGMGSSGLPMAVAVYPSVFTVPQVLVFAGGTILAIGMLCSVSLLFAGFRTRPLAA